jgi:hypothetical protein
MADKPATAQPSGETPMAPGDEAPRGTPGTGEDICPACGGSGRRGEDACDHCLGRGRIIKAISAGP